MEQKPAPLECAGMFRKSIRNSAVMLSEKQTQSPFGTRGKISKPINPKGDPRVEKRKENN